MPIRLQSRDKAPDFEVEDVFGRPLSLHAHRGSLVLLSFYRYTIGPPCHFHFRVNRILQRYPGGRFKFLAIFEADLGHIHSYIYDQCRLPFSVITDPKSTLFKLYRVDLTRWQTLATMLYPPKNTQHYDQPDNLFQHNHIANKTKGKNPADFLVMADGKIEIVHYGRHPTDHLSFTAIERCLGGSATKSITW